MPLDPNISLQAGAGAAAPQNPFDMFTKLLQMRQMNNQNALFQQEFAGRQRLGEIFSQSVDQNGNFDMDSATSNALRDPVAGPFATQQAAQLQATRASQLQVQQGQTELKAKAWADLQNRAVMAAPNLGDPSVLSSTLQEWGKQYPGFVTQQLGDAPQNFIKSIYSNPDGSVASPAQVKARLGQVGINLPAEAYGHAFGTGGMQKNAQGQDMPGVTAPSAFGGGFTPAGGAPAANGAPPQATPGGVSQVFGPSVSQQNYLAAQGKNVADMQQDIQDDMKTLPTAINRLDIMQSTLGKFQAGGGADMRASMAKGLQAARNAGATFISDKLIQDVGNQSLPDTQLFDAEIKPLAIGELKSVAQGTGRVMRSEVDAFLEMMDKTKDPAALMQLLNQARYSLQVGYDQAQKFPEFQKAVASGNAEGFGPGDFYSWYGKKMQGGQLPEGTPGGMNLGAVPLTNAKGVPSPVTKRYTRGANGKLTLVPEAAQ